MGFSWWLSGKESACQRRIYRRHAQVGKIPGRRKYHNPLQYSFWENLMERGTWRATFHGVTKLSMTTKTNATINNNNTYHVIEIRGEESVRKW